MSNEKHCRSVFRLLSTCAHLPGFSLVLHTVKASRLIDSNAYERKFNGGETLKMPDNLAVLDLFFTSISSRNKESTAFLWNVCARLEALVAKILKHVCRRTCATDANGNMRAIKDSWPERIGVIHVMLLGIPPDCLLI